MNQKSYIFFLLLACIVLLPGCWPFSDKNQQLYVINVLDKPEYDDCHIKGSIQVSLEDVETFAKGLNKQTELVIYCSNYLCSGSGHVAQQLLHLGFKNVWAYEAGMAEWFQQGLPHEGKCSASYLHRTIKKPAVDHEVPVISTQELKEKMEKAGLI